MMPIELPLSFFAVFRVVIGRTTALIYVCRNRSIFLLPVADPRSILSKLEKGAMRNLDATYTAFIVPIGFAFAYFNSWNSWYN